MFLIDKPYVSDILIQTLKENNCKIVSTKEARELISDDTLNWVSEEDAIDFLSKNESLPLYTNSENSIAWIRQHFKDSKLSNQIQIFKDKAKFRAFIKEMYLDFFYKTIHLEEIQSISLKGISFPFVIKPALGFFSLGVHIVHNMEDWKTAKKELNKENLQSIYPIEVLDTSTFIIEDYIVGEEYAIDSYFNKDGEIVILNILHHKFSSGKDISDRVYTTSKEIIFQYKEAIEHFLSTIGNKLGLRNFPLHVEIRIDKNGNICPIEVNPLRFGGWCTTADLTWYAYGINSYEYFNNNKKPNWDEIFNIDNNKKYSIVVLNNNSGFSNDKIKSFNYNLLAQDFENVLVTRKVSVKEFSIFGFIFTETSHNNESELDEILVSNLRKYITI